MIYEYHCQACGREWERPQTIEHMERFGSRCPACGTRGTRKFSTPSIIVDHSPSIREFSNPKVKDSIPRDEMKRKRKGI